MPLSSLITELTADGPVLTDGAWGTELQARGLASGELPDFWNLSHPDRVEAVARAYVGAGSQIILTNTFHANRVSAGTHPERERLEEVNRAGVEISRRAAGERAYVFASMGPSGKLLLSGQADELGLEEAFREQAEALASAGPDAIVVETMSDLTEARLAVKAAKSTGLPVVACMVFDSGKNNDRTMTGVTPTQAAEAMTAAGADVVGANCGVGIEACIPVCAALAAATPRPIWIKANAGLPVLEGSQIVYKTTPDEFAGYAGSLRRAGASFIGGCCGTNPEFIAALARRLND